MPDRCSHGSAETIGFDADHELDFYVDVRLRPSGWLATPDLAEDRQDVGSGATRQAAVRRPLRSQGEREADMAAGVR